MAEVKSIVRNCSSIFLGNDALPTEFVTRDYSDKSPSSDSFDIHSLLSDIETISVKHHIGNVKNYGKVEKNTLSDSICTNSNFAKNNVHSNSTSLGALAEKHLRKDRVLNELSGDCAFDFSDLVLDRNSSAKNEKSVSHEQLINLDICFGIEKNSFNTKNTPESDDQLLDDLSDLLELTNVSISQDPISLDSSNSKNLLHNGSKNFSSLCVNDITDSSSGDIYTDSSSSYSSGIGSEKPIFSNESSSDDELIPDIDLSFCIKKNIKVASSDSSEDLGFDEASFIPLKLSAPLRKNVPENDIFSMHRECSPCTGKMYKVSKKSLFSKAISAKPKINEATKEKLKKVRLELIKKSCLFNVIGREQEKNTQSSDKVVDHSDECVVLSNFLKISTENSSFFHSFE